MEGPNPESSRSSRRPSRSSSKTHRSRALWWKVVSVGALVLLQRILMHPKGMEEESDMLNALIILSADLYFSPAALSSMVILVCMGVWVSVCDKIGQLRETHGIGRNGNACVKMRDREKGYGKFTRID